jgi:UDP-N-acetylglucosamine/UDP-N-acetylgalactosamine diphosphorylase
MGVYRGAARVWRNNLMYLGNIRALRAWYAHVRALFVSGVYHQFCWEGALRRLDEVEQERLKRLEEWVAKLRYSADALRASGDASVEADAQESIIRRWPAVKERLLRATPDDAQARDAFLRELVALREGRAYLEVVPSLPKTAKAVGAAWLQGFVDAALAAGLE